MDIFSIIIIVILVIVALKLLSMLFSGLGKILLLALVVLIVYAAFAHASRDKLFDSFVFSDEGITVDEKPFIIKFDSARHPSTVQVSHHQRHYFIPRNECRTITNLYFCFSNSIYDTARGKIKANLSIFKVAPDITIKREIDKPSLVVGEEAEIYVSIANGIGIAAEDFAFVDAFSPDEFDVLNVGGDCDEDENKVVYRGVLRENTGISCWYEIRAINEVERTTRAKVSYFDGTGMKDVFSDEIRFKVEPMIRLETSFRDASSKFFEGDDAVFVINITNMKEDEDFENIAIDISLPSGLEYKGREDLEMYFNETSNTTIRSQGIELVEGKTYQFLGSLKGGVSKFIVMKLKATKAGLSDIFVVSRHAFDGMNYTTEKKAALKVEHKKITLFSSVKDADRFDSGEQKLVKIGVSNPNEKVEFKNVTVRVSTNISNISQGFASSLKPFEAVFVTSQNIEMPNVKSSTTYPFVITAEYHTEHGVYYNESFELRVVVEPVAGISISHYLSRSEVQSGEEFTVRAMIKNERNTDIRDIRVYDTAPLEFQKKGLSSVSGLNVNAKDEAAAYEYRMTAPEVDTPVTYTFTTTAAFTDDEKSYFFERTYQVSVKPRTIDISISRSLPDANLYMGAALDVKYVVTNPDEKKTLKNIKVAFPMQPDTDLIGPTEFVIDRLLPGESYTVSGAHRIRAKKNGSIRIAPAIFTYYDERGNVFTKNSSEISFNAEEGYISGPAFILEKASNETVFAGERISVQISVKNVGSETGRVKIEDSGNSWGLEISPSETDIIRYTVKAGKEGIVNFRPAVASYFYMGRPAYTISNAAQTNVTGKAAEALEDERGASEDEEIKEVVIEKVSEEAKEKTFFSIVWEALKSAFAIFKR